MRTVGGRTVIFDGHQWKIYDDFYQSGKIYDNTIFDQGTDKDCDDFKTELIQSANDPYPWNFLIGVDVQNEIRDNQDVCEDPTVFALYSEEESRASEKAKEHENAKVALNKMNVTMCEEDGDLDKREEITSIYVAKTEPSKIDAYPTTDQRKSKDDEEMGKDLKPEFSETTKRENINIKRGYRRKKHHCEEVHCIEDDNRQHGSTFDGIFTGSLIKMKTSKKVFFLLILMLTGIYPATSAAIHNEPKQRGLEEYRLLITSKCKYRDLIRSETCHTNEESRDMYINYCGFSKLCDLDSEPICVDGEYGGMLHICSPKNLTCAKGYRRKAWLDNDTDIVHVKEEKCHQGRYQPTESTCYHNCSNRHEDLKDLPPQYSLFSMGDNKSPTWIYCNFEKGFYNMDGKFLLEYNDQFQHYPYFCTSTTDDDPCDPGEYPLPNGTCVSPCQDGLKRDAHDEFRCNIKIWSEIDVSTQKKKSSKTEYPQTTSTMVDLTSSTMSVRNTLTTEKEIQETNEDDGIRETLQDFSIAVIVTVVLLILIFCTLFIGLSVFCYIRFKNRSRKTVHITRVRKTENKFEHAEHVTIFHTTTGSRTDDSPEELHQMQNLIRQDEDV